MRKLKLIEWIAVAAALVVVSLFVFPTWFGSIFFPSNASPVGGTAPTAPIASTTSATAPTTTMQNISTVPGLLVYDVSAGTGAPAVSGSQVTVNYVGTLSDGTVFDTSASHGQPFTFTLGAGQVIKGWDEGLLGMKVGGKRELVISPDLGYGDNQVGPIPPGSTLVFQVELVSVK
jgi:FKBP-type peptidyl-prolyl cis-trans isomerase FkpA